MEDKVKKVLFVNSEMAPFLSDSEIGAGTLALAQGIQDQRVEIRSFMPRYGLVNERKNQLHEVIRLSGMNIIIDAVDRPLIIKVASLPAARMQVYFIDNEDYFKRKALFKDEGGVPFKDNGERAVFFARGVLETVKKLRWSPDVIHCSGWISNILPLYLKKCYKEDPIFTSSKVVTTLYNDIPEGKFNEGFIDALQLMGISKEDLAPLRKSPDGVNLAKVALQNSDGVIFGESGINKDIANFAISLKLPRFAPDKKKSGDELWADYKAFYNSLL